MRLHEVLKTNQRAKKRLGRGPGSGKGKTAGRGTKGQKARGKIPVGFSGGLALYKKLPLTRGQGNLKLGKKPTIINLDDLNPFKAKEIIDVEKLLQAKIISSRQARNGVKLLSDGEIKTALTVNLVTSKAARTKIEKAGGLVKNV